MGIDNWRVEQWNNGDLQRTLVVTDDGLYHVTVDQLRFMLEASGWVQTATADGDAA